MWKQYRKTLVPTQLVIFTICLIALFVAKLPIVAVLIYLAVMQAFAIIGAAWAVRLQNKIEFAKKRRKGLLV